MTELRNSQERHPGAGPRCEEAMLPRPRFDGLFFSFSLSHDDMAIFSIRGLVPTSTDPEAGALCEQRR